MNDLKFAFRQLLKNPGFTAVAVLTLALGIGANSSMFSIMNTILFRALPFPESARLVRVFRTAPQSQSWPHSVANFLDQRSQNGVFERMAALSWSSFNLAEPGEPAERVRGMIATVDFFPTLGVHPALGRVFTKEEDQPGRNQVVVLSHGYWVDRFAGDTNIVGRTVRLDGELVSIVGVMPANFDYPLLWGQVDAWRPAAFSAEQRGNRGNNWLQSIARLKPGVSLDQAEAELRAIAARLVREHEPDQAHTSLRLVPLRESGMDDVGRRISWMTFGLAGFVLLIACANLANLQLARLSARTRELAVRAALGAKRGRLIRGLLTESVLLALAGGLAGLLVALWGNDWIGRRMVVGDQIGFTVPLDGSALAFTAIVSVVSGLAFGIVPAWLAAGTDINQALKQGGRAVTADRSQRRFRHGLIMAEVALAVALLSGTGLFVRGLQRFTHRDPGWKTDGLLTARVSLPAGKYGTSAQRHAFLQELNERLGTVPGVERAALSWSVPIWSFASSGTIAVEGRTFPLGQEPNRFLEAVTPQYFETLGIRLLQGRGFTASDGTNAPAVAIINETLARLFWPDENPIGKRIGDTDPAHPNWVEIIGVVNDVRLSANLATPHTRLQVYRPLAQTPRGFATITLRSAVAPESLGRSLRRTVSEMDSDLPVFEMRTAREATDRILANFSLVGWTLGASACLGLLLAALGLYGVIAHTVAQRTNELGVRLALGAPIRDLFWLVLGSGLKISVLGLLIGLAGALGLERVLRSVVPELPVRDPVALVGVALVLLGTALIACWIPARRTAQIDPIEALRSE